MQERIRALLVFGQGEPVRDLQTMLSNQFVKTVRVQTCAAAAAVLRQANPPDLVFTEPALEDGSWSDVLGAVASAPAAVNLIVVARLVEMKHYLEIIERGAFDLMVPPFSALDLAHVVKCASADVLNRRGMARKNTRLGHSHVPRAADA